MELGIKKPGCNKITGLKFGRPEDDCFIYIQKNDYKFGVQHKIEFFFFWWMEERKEFY